MCAGMCVCVCVGARACVHAGVGVSLVASLTHSCNLPKTLTLFKRHGVTEIFTRHEVLQKTTEIVDGL